MTTGIYLLRFNSTDKVYIGQSLHIEKRYTAHCRAMSLGIASSKVQQAYSLYGLPNLEVLVECEKGGLNALEAEAIEIYNSVENGFNTYIGGSYSPAQVGELASNSMYSNSEYIQALKLLVLYNFSIKDVSAELGMSSSVLLSIRKCENHKWLKDVCPEEYAKLLERKRNYSAFAENTAKARGIQYPTLISPDGKSYEVHSLRAFAREHNLASSNLEVLLNGKGYSLKGWTVKDRPKPTYPVLVSSDGSEYVIKYGEARKFAMEHKMSPAKLSELLNGKITSYKNWTTKIVQ